MVAFSIDDVADEFQEIASAQRLNIIQRLYEKKFTVSSMARELEATAPEVHRNFGRLTKSGIIVKDTDANYHLTLFGKTIYKQISSIMFIASKKKYFAEHDFGNIPIKFVHRIGELENSKMVKGYVKVFETWNSIYKNAEKYIYNILVEVSYNSDLGEILIQKLESNVKIHSIFSDMAIVSEERQKMLKEKNFKKFITNDTLKRKMNKSITLVVVLNEREATINFPTNSGEVDLSKMFYSTDPLFHEWCLDYFDYLWKNSGSFRESKLSI